MAEPISSAEPSARGPSLAVIVNRAGGTAARLGDALATKVTQAFADAGLPIDLHLVDGGAVAELVSRIDAPVIVVGGGDGTLGAAAGVLAGKGTALGILPLGTRNHLALQLGIPPDLGEAARLIAAGQTRKIDLGAIGDRVFVNNCSVGLYTRLVRDRDRRWLPKWLATVPAAWKVLRSLRSQHFRLVFNGEEHRLQTPLLFIGNNRYSLKAGRVGERDRLDDGVLSLACVAPVTQAGLAVMALRIVVGRADPERDFAALEEVPELTIYGHHRRDVAIDGEVVAMKFPLRLCALPGALSVIAPAG